MNHSLNNKELVAVGHQFAKAMSSDTPIIDMAKIVSRLAERLDCTTAALREMTKNRDALAAENAHLLNGAARELNTSWMFHKTMLGAQAALVCLSHGYQAAAREWLEGTTDEAGAEIPDDISVGELHEWFDSQMVSNDGNSGFLTRAEAEEAIKKACPATDAFRAEARAQGVEMFAEQQRSFIGKPSKNDAASSYSSREAISFAAQLRKGAAQ